MDDVVVCVPCVDVDRAVLVVSDAWVDVVVTLTMIVVIVVVIVVEVDV